MSLALLLAAVIEINAQEMESPVGKFSVIPHVGVGISNWSNNELSFNGSELLKSKYQAGFNGGVDVEYRATKEVAVSHTWPARKFDVSIPIGVSYEYMGVVLSAQYNLGLTNVSDAPKEVDKNCKNKGFGLSVGYRFTL